MTYFNSLLCADVIETVGVNRDYYYEYHFEIAEFIANIVAELQSLRRRVAALEAA